MVTPVQKRLRRRVRTALLGVSLFFLAWLPRRLGRALGRGLGRLGWTLGGSARRRTRAHLAIAFPEESETWREDIGRRSFAHLGESFLETLWWDRHRDRLDTLLVEAEGTREILDAALAEGRGVLAVAGHIGSWELGAQAMSARGYSISGVGRESHDAGLRQMMHDFRLRGGVTTFYRGSPRAGIDVLRALRKGDLMLLLIDQDTRADSIFVPFFGKLAKTPRGPADLALRRRIPVVMAFQHREGDHHVLEVKRIPLPDTGDHEADVRTLTTVMTAAIEDHLKAHPVEWVWFHRRWKTRPEGEG